MRNIPVDLGAHESAPNTTTLLNRRDLLCVATLVLVVLERDLGRVPARPARRFRADTLEEKPASPPSAELIGKLTSTSRVANAARSQETVMGKKHEDKHRPRNAEQPPRADELSATHQLAYTAAGAAGSALLGAILTRKGWAPKAVSGTLAVLGALLAGMSDSETLRAVGAGAMSGSGAQLVLMLFAEHEDKKRDRSGHSANDGLRTGTRGDSAVTAGDAMNGNVPRIVQAAAS